MDDKNFSLDNSNLDLGLKKSDKNNGKKRFLKLEIFIVGFSLGLIVGASLALPSFLGQGFIGINTDNSVDYKDMLSNQLSTDYDITSLEL